MEHSVRGNLDMMILAVLAEGPAHGYAQIEALRARSGGVFDVAEGTLYPALHKLEKGGLVRSQWDRSSARKRRVYEITAPGRRALADQHDRWSLLRDAVDSVLRGTALGGPAGESGASGRATADPAVTSTAGLTAGHNGTNREEGPRWLPAI